MSTAAEPRFVPLQEIADAGRGRWTEILAALGVPASLLDGQHGPCPHDGGKDRHRFHDPNDGRCICNQCNPRGTRGGVESLAWYLKIPFAESRKRVVEHLQQLGLLPNGRPATPSTAPPPAAPSTPDASANGHSDLLRKRVKLRALWGDALPDHPRLRSYLRHRGLSINPPPALRLAESVAYYDTSSGKPVKIGDYPAVVALVHSPGGQIVGIHRTYLSPRTDGKAEVADAKKMESLYPGSTSGGAVHLYPADGPTLVLTEGIETALAVREALPDVPVWSYLNAGNLAKVELPSNVETVYVMADNDSSGVGQRAARDAAARLVGWGLDVRVAIPPVEGNDWLDELVQHGPQVIADAVANAEKIELPAPPARPVATSTTTTAPSLGMPAPAVQGPGTHGLRVGMTVVAPDRGNIGRITHISGDRVSLAFVNPETGKTGSRDYTVAEILAANPGLASDGGPGSTGAAAEPFDLKMMTTAELLRLDCRPSWLVEKCFVEGQFMVCGGKSKTLKTSVLCDLIVSLGTGSPFLNTFPVPRAVPVGFITTESGPWTIQETVLRIARQRGRTISDAPIWWRCEPVRLLDPTHLEAVEKFIKEHGLKALGVDPAYLNLFDPAAIVNPSGGVLNFGPMLGPLVELATRLNVMPFLAHHFKKSAGGGNAYEAPTLDDLSQSGFAEICRQWLLLGRRRRYEGDGRHELHLSIGGSCGQSFEGVLAIDEGHPAETDLGGRRWVVSVQRASEAIEADRESRDELRERERDQRDERQLQRHCQRIIEILERCQPEGRTKSDLAALAKLSRENATRALDRLLSENAIVQTTVTKNRRPEDAYALASDARPDTPGHARTRPDLSDQWRPDGQPSPLGGCPGAPRAQHSARQNENCPGAPLFPGPRSAGSSGDATGPPAPTADPPADPARPAPTDATAPAGDEYVEGEL